MEGVIILNSKPHKLRKVEKCYALETHAYTSLIQLKCIGLT